MTDGIGRIFGGNNYGVGGFAPRKQEEEVNQNAQPQQPAVNYAETQVDPSKVMEFMANNNFFVAPTQNTTASAELDAEAQERIGNYMENFEMIYGVIVEEFGEELAPMVMDMTMDHLMGMAA